MFFFDVCGTLYDKNTTFTYVCFYHRYKRNYLRFLLVSFYLSVFGKILNKYFGVSIRSLIIKTLRNEKKSNLEEVADIYIVSFLEKHKSYKIHSVFLEMIDLSKEDVVLVSASIDVVINALSRKYNIQFYSSELEYLNGKASGQLAVDLKGSKNGVIKRLSTSGSVFYTDNFDDLPCANFVNKLYFVVKKPKSVNKLEVSNNVSFIYI